MDGTADIHINCEKDNYPDTIIDKKLSYYSILLVASPTDTPTNEFDTKITANKIWQRTMYKSKLSAVNPYFKTFFADYLDIGCRVGYTIIKADG